MSDSCSQGPDLSSLNRAERHRFERDVALFNLGVLDMIKLVSMPKVQAAGYLAALETDAGNKLQEMIRASMQGD